LKGRTKAGTSAAISGTDFTASATLSSSSSTSFIIAV
jgi:hypothetical protein